MFPTPGSHNLAAPRTEARLLACTNPRAPLALPAQGADVNFTYCEFTGNSAKLGGAVLVQDPTSKAEFVGCNFWQASRAW